MSDGMETEQNSVICEERIVIALVLRRTGHVDAACFFSSSASLRNNPGPSRSPPPHHCLSLSVRLAGLRAPRQLSSASACAGWLDDTFRGRGPSRCGWNTWTGLHICRIALGTKSSGDGDLSANSSPANFVLSIPMLRGVPFTSSNPSFPRFLVDNGSWSREAWQRNSAEWFRVTSATLIVSGAHAGYGRRCQPSRAEDKRRSRDCEGVAIPGARGGGKEGQDPAHLGLVCAYLVYSNVRAAQRCRRHCIAESKVAVPTL